MEKSETLNNNRVIILSCALAFVVIAIACTFIYTNRTKTVIVDKPTNTCKEVSMEYRPIPYNTEIAEISLSNSEKEELIGILNKIEVSEPIESTTEVKYELKFCNDLYLIGDNDKITKNGKNVKITSGYDDLKAFIERKNKDINGAYLYLIDKDYNYQKVDITEDDKNNIRNHWKAQDKHVEHLDLALLTKYALVIDGETISTDERHHYAAYNDGFVVLDERIGAIIDKYFPTAEATVSPLKYTIDNNMTYHNEKFKDRGVYYDTLNQPNAPSIFTIASGEKNNGGYSINIDKVDIDADGNVIVHVIEQSPAPDEYVVMAITYPICSITFEKHPKSIKVITDTNEELKLLNRN